MIVGIDCGYRTGGVALIGDDHAEVHDLPVFDEGGVDVAELERLIRTFADPEHVYIEKQGAMPSQGVSSTFKLGYAFGQITSTVALTVIAAQGGVPAVAVEVAFTEEIQVGPFTNAFAVPNAGERRWR